MTALSSGIAVLTRSATSGTKHAGVSGRGHSVMTIISGQNQQHKKKLYTSKQAIIKYLVI